MGGKEPDEIAVILGEYRKARIVVGPVRHFGRDRVARHEIACDCGLGRVGQIKDLHPCVVEGIELIKLRDLMKVGLHYKIRVLHKADSLICPMDVGFHIFLEIMVRWGVSLI